MEKEYTSKTFHAWYVEEEVFQLQVFNYPVILSLTYHQFNNLRKDIINSNIKIDEELDFFKDMLHIRIYGVPHEEKVYLIFKELEAVSIGFTRPLLIQFCKDIISFNPKGEFEGYKFIVTLGSYSNVASDKKTSSQEKI